MSLAVLCALALALGGGDEELENWVRALDEAHEPQWTEAFDHLVQRGADAAERVLADFEHVGSTARRGRAELLAELPDPARCERLLALSADPDPEVRRRLARALGDLALADATGARRVARLEELARADQDDAVRGAAREALAECALPEAVEALDRLLEGVPASEAEDVARALARLPSARERLVARVVSAFEQPTRLPDGVLSELLRAYGRALAEVPHGGRDARERVPFLLGRLHRSESVRDAANVAWAVFLARCAELTEPMRADEVLALLASEGWPAEPCLRRRLDLAVLERGDFAQALVLARELAAHAATLPEEEADFWEQQALFYEGAALFATDRLAEAGDLFDGLVRRLDAVRARRLDRFPATRTGTAANAGAAWAVDGLELLALARTWRALVYLAAERDDPRVLDELRRAHLLFFEARATAHRGGNPDPSSLDVLFERDLSPHVLVLLNEHVGPERRGPTLDLAVALAEAWATVAGEELLGFQHHASARRELTDPFFDGPRLEALQNLRRADEEDLQRRFRDLRSRDLANPDNARWLAQLYQHRLGEIDRARKTEEKALAAGAPATTEALRELYANLASYLTFSLHGIALANELRQENRPAEARAIAERALASLRAGAGGSSPVYAEWASARYDSLRGATFMDEGRAREAEDAYLESVRRLEGLERTFEELRGPSEDKDSMDAQVRMIRDQRADSLLSLAVNANVRLHDPARALQYFEQAYELNQNAFMRILRACYRARSGKVTEARSVLASVAPTPSLYYNIACTHALLGDKELALDFLERDLRENYPTPGSLARQREWARKDPDLAALASEPRFVQLVGGEPR